MLKPHPAEECQYAACACRAAARGTPVDAKPTNPKDLIGSDKMPYHLWPPAATALGSLALLEGALKYGRGNWRPIGVRASIYYDACLRHLYAWFEGEDCAPDSGVHHLGHALACLAILIDADAAHSLTDDRAFPGGYHSALARATTHVPVLKARHADQHPHHYTIEDLPPCSPPCDASTLDENSGSCNDSVIAPGISSTI